MKKKILVIALALSLVAVTALGVTLAYFTDTEEAVNTFTVGNVNIELREPLWNGNTFTGDPGYTGDKNSLGMHKAIAIAPGDVIPKDPQVRNVGTNDAYIRIKMIVSEEFLAAEDRDKKDLFDLDWNRVFYPTAADNGKWHQVGFGPMGDKYVIEFQYLGTLAPGHTTMPLFTNITLKTDKDNADWEALRAQGLMDITIVAEAIQADNFGTAADAFAALNAQGALPYPAPVVPPV